MTSGAAPAYVMRISRLTIDKLGVKLYDTASAVVAELVANSFDADAEKVTIRLPLSTVLGTKGDAAVAGSYVIEVEDDGHGMTPHEARALYLEVGRDRRQSTDQGPRSREKKRPVMGRKGIGKLAPFGICRRIEVRSAGGAKTPKGYLTAHFTMDYGKILQPTDEPVPLDPGPDDGAFSENHGTLIRLTGFLPKRVPDAETFHRQLSRRFLLGPSDFRVFVQDTRGSGTTQPVAVEPFSIPLLEGSKLDVAGRPVRLEDGSSHPVTGWLGLAKSAYQNEEMAGVRIYARKKLVATTRDFEQPAGFTGEFTMRSYLVGEVAADWLDLDEGDDLIRTDRQNILWESEYGRALRDWGASLIREIGAASRKPRRARVSKLFLEKAKLAEHARERFSDERVVEVALELGERIGAFAAEDELDDLVYVEDLRDIILSVAPHQALIQALQEFSQEFSGKKPTLDSLVDLFGKARVAEMASYSQIAAERVRVIRELEGLVTTSTDEDKLQNLLAKAPWLIEPKWTVLTKNQALATFKKTFEAFWKRRSGRDLVLTTGEDWDGKRPDFALAAVGDRIYLIEIKAADHAFDDADFERLANYPEALDEFFEANKDLALDFPLLYKVLLIADGESLKKPVNKQAFRSLIKEGKVERISWGDFLRRTTQGHQAFLDASDAARKRGGQ